MNELIELLEMQQDLEDLITEAVGELTVSEYKYLEEAGILDEAAASVLLKTGKGAKKGVEVIMPTVTKAKDAAARLASSKETAARLERLADLATRPGKRGPRFTKTRSAVGDKIDLLFGGRRRVAKATDSIKGSRDFTRSGAKTIDDYAQSLGKKSSLTPQQAQADAAYRHILGTGKAVSRTRKQAAGGVAGVAGVAGAGTAARRRAKRKEAERQEALRQAIENSKSPVARQIQRLKAKMKLS